MIHYPCPRCGEGLESPDSLAGTTEQCPKCRTRCRVPTPQTRHTKRLISLAALVLIVLVAATILYLRAKDNPKAGMERVAKRFVDNLRVEFSAPEVDEDDDVTLLYTVPDSYTLDVQKTANSAAPYSGRLTIDMPTLVTAPPQNLAADPRDRDTLHTINSFTFTFAYRQGQWALDSAEVQVRRSDGTPSGDALDLHLELAGPFVSRLRHAYDAAAAGQALSAPAAPPAVADATPPLPPFPAAQLSATVRSEDLGPVPAAPFIRTQTSDGRHLAWIDSSGGKQRVFVDGKPGPEFAAISNRGLTLSSDGKHIAYAVLTDGKLCTVIDDNVGPAYDNPVMERFARPTDGAAVAFSPDGNHVAYGAVKNHQWFMVRDGKESPAHAFVGAPLFSPDSAHLAYFVQDGGKYSLILDGKSGLAFDALGWMSSVPLFSPDSQRVAYVISQNKRQSVVLDGQAGPSFDTIETNPVYPALVFSPDSKRFAYVASRGENNLAVLDGQPGPEYQYIGEPTFSPDSRHFAYSASKTDDTRLTVLDGQPHPEWSTEWGFFYSPDGSHRAFTTQSGRRIIVVLDDRPGPKLQGAQDLLFSPDSAHLAYRASAGINWFVVLDGIPGPLFENPGGLGIVSCDFSPDGNHLAYIAKNRGKDLVVVDGKSGPEFDEIIRTDLYHGSLSFDPDGTVVYLAIKDGRLVRVTQ